MSAEKLILAVHVGTVILTVLSIATVLFAVGRSLYVIYYLKHTDREDGEPTPKPIAAKTPMDQTFKHVQTFTDASSFDSAWVFQPIETIPKDRTVAIENKRMAIQISRQKTPLKSALLESAHG